MTTTGNSPETVTMEHSPPGNPIEVDSTSDYDSDSIKSDLTSVTSSIFNYEYENGRRYHAYQAGKYMLPNDDREQDRLDILHHVYRLTLNGELCRTRLANPQKILDVGTGTGIWAIEIGDQFPSAEVIGTDLSPIQPSWVPPNVRYQMDDAEQEWAFPKNSFDFIHIRGLAGSIRNWPELLRQSYIHLKPGGRIEVSEGRPHMDCDDGTFPKDSYTWKWIEEFYKIAHSVGLEFDMFPQYAGLLRSAGFENVESHEEPTPIGTWPKNKRLKEIGLYFGTSIMAAVDAYSLAMYTRYGNWTVEETQVLIAHVRRELKTNKMHVYTHCSYATAQKPE